jgi:hypothetical protein
LLREIEQTAGLDRIRTLDGRHGHKRPTTAYSEYKKNQQIYTTTVSELKAAVTLLPKHMCTRNTPSFNAGEREDFKTRICFDDCDFYKCGKFCRLSIGDFPHLKWRRLEVAFPFEQQRLLARR